MGIISPIAHMANGKININDKPGLGIEVDEQAAKKYPYLRRLRPSIRR